ncbi:uncharacterized protein LOC123554295 [Mercenaria mercenaria]|uniref:uncharacterized protein LOC123554295 n=1 Tax=Mercenaria mercenaria TaxID=6596 RepID=UPI00234E38F5|nr:uncharacterized protein LOC123554295 [Mercenaria mercenaria]XP_053404232.1 uncharacterized protein LOC123554295 [Mercenaria mercenaria]
MAEAALGQEEQEYDVFLVHSSEDNYTAHQINKGLKHEGFNTYAHYKEGVEFPAGRPVFDNIIHAVKQSKIILILLTKNAMKSHWVTFEVLMGLEKSHRENKMCVRLVFQGVSETERKEFKKGAFHWIPDVIIDFNKDTWMKDLADKLREDVTMHELLPAGNVAHGLVFNYYIGFLAYVLPATEETVEKCEYSRQGNFSKKFFIIIPESCKISPIEGRHGEYTIEKMEKPLDMDASHGDKKRKYNPSVYRISKDNFEESYFFTADIPFILATMSKMNEMGFVEIDLHIQMVRFKMTLMELVQHRENLECRDTANFIAYKDEEESPAQKIWDSVVHEFKARPAKDTTKTVARKKAQIIQKGEEITATITHLTDHQADHDTAAEVENFLSQKNVLFTNGEGKMNFEVLKDARWNIFILSDAAIADNFMKAQFQAALECSISDNEVQVIPILAECSDIKMMPDIFKWTTLLKRDEPGYLDKLWTAMQESRKMLELLSSGKVYEGLAYAYFINYMPYTLTYRTPEGRDFKERFIDAKEKYNIKDPCVARVYVIVPKSCSFPPPGSNFKKEEHLGPLEPVVLGFRKYFLQLYRLTMSSGEKVCYAREYATPAVALHDMAQLPFAGLSKEAMNEQAEKFSNFSEEIMRNPIFNEKIGDVRDKCEMVYFDDEKMGKEGVTDELEKRLIKCLQKGNYV